MTWVPETQSGGGGGGVVSQGAGGVSPWLVTGPLTDVQLRATAVPVSYAALLTELQLKADLTETQPVSGPLTDVQLRATAVPVSGTVTATGPLTDTQLRASAVPISLAIAPTTPVTGTFWQVTQPVSGTFWQATQPVSGTFWQATQPVSGTFWQATQPISAVSLPLPAGAATAANQQTNALTDTQLRASPVVISGAVVTL